MPTFPVDLKAYLGGCARMEQQTFDLGEGLQVQNRTAGGELLRSGGAARLWRGTLSLIALQHEKAREMHAKLHVMRSADASFYIGDMTHMGGTRAAQFMSINTATGVFRLKGLSAGYVIKPGDYMAFDYSGRRAFHQFETGGIASASGELGALEVVPPLRPGSAVTDRAVTVGAVKCRAVMVPGAARVGASNRVVTTGISFDWTQTLRENP